MNLNLILLFFPPVLEEAAASPGAVMGTLCYPLLLVFCFSLIMSHFLCDFCFGGVLGCHSVSRLGCWRLSVTARAKITVLIFILEDFVFLIGEN